MGKIIIPPESPGIPIPPPSYGIQFSWTRGGLISAERFYTQAEAESYADEVLAAHAETEPDGDYGVVRVKNAEDYDPDTDPEPLPDRVYDPGNYQLGGGGLGVVYLPLSPVEEG